MAQPSVITTLFPHLGHHKVHEFRWALLLGLAIDVVLVAWFWACPIVYRYQQVAGSTFVKGHAVTYACATKAVRLVTAPKNHVMTYSCPGSRVLAIAHPAHTAFNDITDSELLADLAHVDRAALVAEG